MEESNNLKREINNAIKLVKIEFKGKKSEDRLIDIADILRRYVRNGIVPRSVKFNAYNLNSIRNQIIRQHLLNETDLLEEVNRYNNISREYTELINEIRESKNEFNNYKIMSYNGLNIIYARDLDEIRQMINRFEIRKSQFDFCEFQNMVNFCADRFQDNVIYELNLYEIYEMTEEIMRSIDSISNKIRNIEDINNFGINLTLITDISDEMMEMGFCNDISGAIDEDIFNYINRYNQIYRN